MNHSWMTLILLTTRKASAVLLKFREGKKAISGSAPFMGIIIIPVSLRYLKEKLELSIARIAVRILNVRNLIAIIAVPRLFH